MFLGGATEGSSRAIQTGDLVTPELGLAKTYVRAAPRFTYACIYPSQSVSRTGEAERGEDRKSGLPEKLRQQSRMSRSNNQEDSDSLEVPGPARPGSTGARHRRNPSGMRMAADDPACGRLKVIQIPNSLRITW